MLGALIGNWQRLVVYGAVALALLAGAAAWGYSKGVERLYVYQAEQAKQAVAVAIKQSAATERVITKFVKVQGATQTVTQTVEKEVVRYVETNSGSCLDSPWGRLHDAAATNTLPAPARGTDAAPGAAQALATVTANYAACHRTSDRLTALQDFSRQQAAIQK